MVSRHVHESDLDRMDRTVKRWFVAWLITFILLVGCVAGFVWYENQWEYVQESTTTEVTQEAGGNGTNNYIGGDYFGSSEDQDNQDNEKENS